jgi:hypothetical protein
MYKKPCKVTVFLKKKTTKGKGTRLPELQTIFVLSKVDVIL